MDNRRITAVIFDLGKVLVDFDYLISTRKISEFADKNPQEIFDLFFDSELTSIFEEGRISPRDFFLKIKEKLNLRLDYDRFTVIWNEIFFFTAKNAAVYNLAKGLKDNYKLAVLSNTNILHFEYIKKKFSVFDIFDTVVTSFEVGSRKPNPLIYKKTLEKLEVLPENVFYADDRKDLVLKANELGIRSFVFTGIEQLQKDLLGAGISIN